MKPLILTGWLMPDFVKGGFGRHRARSGFFPFRLGTSALAGRSRELSRPSRTRPAGRTHWSDWGGFWKQSENRSTGSQPGRILPAIRNRRTVVRHASECATELVWLLDYFSSDPETVARLKLRVVDQEMIGLVQMLWKVGPPLISVIEKDLATASAAWQAYRSPTPEACFDLLHRDLSALPLLRPVLRDLLEELPSVSTGLGATEMRMLEMIASGYANVNPLFHSARFARRASSTSWSWAICLKACVRPAPRDRRPR